MKRKIVGIAVAAFVLMIGVTAALAAHERGEWQKDPVGHMVRHMSRRLDLSDAQQTQVRSILEAERPNVQPLVQQLLEGRRQMAAAEKDGFDEAKVRTIAAQQAQNITELIVIKERVQSKVYQVLTPEQRTKFDQMRQQRIDHMQQWLSKSAPAS
jgi:periplasmic protein CpxP/Spy